MGVDNKHSSQRNITAPEILATIKKSIKDPSLHSGPSSNFLGAVASAIASNNTLQLALNQRPFRQMYGKYLQMLYKGTWTTEKFKIESHNHEVPVGLVDGGLLENTGIAAAVKNLQQHGKNKGNTIFAIVPWESNHNQLKMLFAGETLSWWEQPIEKAKEKLYEKAKE